MEYIIFLITIQIPFLYFIWKVFKTHQNRTHANLRMLETRMGQIRNLVEALRLSMEKSSDNLEKDMEKLRAIYALTSARINQLEKYTGLEEAGSTPSLLKNHDFTETL